MITSLALPERRVFSDDLKPKVTFPDFMTSARRELSVSAVFLVLPGAILLEVRGLAGECWRRTSVIVDC